MFKNFLKGLKEVCDDLMDSNVGEELKKAGKELKAQFLQEETSNTAQTAGGSTMTASNVSAAPASASTNTEAAEAPKKTLEAPATYEAGDAEVALSVPAEDGERGEFTGLDEKTYSYLLPKDPGFVDEGNCHAAEIHQAYGFGKEVNYTRDMMMYFSIAPEFDCEIKESRPKAAFARYDGAPTRSRLMTVEHPFFTHAYLFENSKIYRISYLKQISESEILACELALKKSGGDEAWKEKMIAEFKRFAGSCREV